MALHLTLPIAIAICIKCGVIFSKRSSYIRCSACRAAGHTVSGEHRACSSCSAALRPSSRNANCDVCRHAIRETARPTVPITYASSTANWRPLQFGSMDVACPHCGALFWADEVSTQSGRSFSKCCLNGSLSLDYDPIPEPPPLFRELFGSNSSRAKLLSPALSSFFFLLSLTVSLHF